MRTWNSSLMWRVGLHILSCCRLGRCQQFVWRLKVKTTVLCVQLAAEQCTYCVLAKVRPTVCINIFRCCLGGTAVATQRHTTWQTDGFQCWSYPSPCHPPAATLKCELHIRQNACDNPRSLLPIQCRSSTHAWRNFEAYFVFELQRGADFEFALGFAVAMSIHLIASTQLKSLLCSSVILIKYKVEQRI